MFKRWLVFALVIALAVQSGTPIRAASTEVERTVQWVDKSPIWFSIGHNWLQQPLWEDGDQFEQFTWSGPTNPDSTGWLDPTAEGVNGELKHGRPIYYKVVYDTIVGGNHPRFGDKVIFECKVRYKPDGTPEYIDPHTGLPFDGFFLRMGALVTLRELRQWRNCAWFIAASISMGAVGAGCWNPIWFKSLEEGDQTFDEQLANLDSMLQSLQSKSADNKRFYIPLMFNSHDVAGLTVQTTYKIGGQKVSAVRRINFDWDGDGLDNGTEIIDGTDPYDPNDPGNPTTLVEVPCMPDGAHWNLTDAQNSLLNADLAVGDVLHEPSSLAAGCFIRFMPVCGSQIPRGTEVNIVISSGPVDNTVEIPCYVIGDPYNAYDDELRDRLLAAGFLAANIHRHVIYCPGSSDVGDVGDWQAADCWQTYKWSWQCGDRGVPATTQLHYWVKGCLPCFQTGCDAEDVISQFENAGFMVVVAEQFHPTIAAGGLISYTPGCGDEVTDCVANVCVSKGPQTSDTAVVPSVLNKTEAQGIATLAAVDSRLTMSVIERVYSSSVAEGLILFQDPISGTTVNLPKVVNVKVSKGPQPPNALVVTITSPADNFVGTVGQTVSFACTVSGGTAPYDNFKWHFADNSFKYQQNVTKTFDFPGAGWCYIDVTDHAGNVAQDKVWVQINTAP